ncbi:MAG TPA: FAD-dependent oxidoreductase [Candidatus Udaeobacter sp.]|nr:FAD-dependent oxidoreductase [Candidatus Udaeobacter sp.]
MPGKPHFDLLIVGGGQCGVPLAHALAGPDRSVALAERARLGGSCVNFGCTPSKAAIASARLAHDARRAADFGLRIPEVEADYAAVIARAGAIAEESRRGLERRFEGRENPLLLRGHARFTGRAGHGFALRVGELDCTASQVVLDTGTRTRVPEIPGLEETPFLHSGNWLAARDRPEHVVFIGGGVISLEMGQCYSRLGIEVTIVARSEWLGGREDPDVAEALRAMLEREGIRFFTSAAVDRVRRDGHAVDVSIVGTMGSQWMRATHLFIAAGRRPNTDDLGLDSVGVDRDEDGFVRVDERLATSVEGIWAAGDIRGGPMFTHASWDDHRILRSQLDGDGTRTTRRIMPYAIFTDPELGRVGMTEAEARHSGRDFEVRRFDMAANGRARESGESSGFIKLLVERKSNHILGAAVLAAGGAELVHAYVDLMNAGAPATVIEHAIHIHPTLSEAVQSAVTARPARSTAPAARAHARPGEGADQA